MIIRENHMRLNRYLASCGVASRRKCDQMIEQGKVQINGIVATLGAVITPGKDKITVEGNDVQVQTKSYYLLYKPVNVLTTLSDPEGRPTIAQLIKNIPQRVFPVGRLDFDSEGLLLLTNDGNLAHRTQHPKYEIEKEYRVRVSHKLSSDAENQFRQGINLEEGITRPCSLDYLNNETYKVIIHQGWYRQIRRMFEQLGTQVVALKRVRIGNLELSHLKPGGLRVLTPAEIKGLRKILFAD